MGFRLDGVYEPPASRFAGPPLNLPLRGGGGRVASQKMGGMAFFLIFAPANRVSDVVSVCLPARRYGYYR